LPAAATRWWKRLAEASGGSFIANDCRLLGKQKMVVITGPQHGR
jgi:DNA mismatch repair ATPase MutS